MRHPCSSRRGLRLERKGRGKRGDWQRGAGKEEKGVGDMSG